MQLSVRTHLSRTVLERFVLFSAMSCSLLAQTFDAATVRPRDPSDPPGGLGCSGGPGTKDPHLYRCTSVAIVSLAATAYNVSLQDMDAPQWTATTLNGYDIQAVVPEGATQDEFRTMLQSLLAERFHLKWHREMRQLDSYILTAPKPKIRQSSPDARESLMGSNFNRDHPIRILARGMTLQRLADLLVPFVQKRVVNETNLEAAFDFDLEFVALGSTAPTDGTSPFAALSDLGLSLKAGKRPVYVFVIDTADRVPTPN
jgi:uncharacterized protein (TIGR03435 family)